MTRIKLAGCRTEPLADYLKALAVLRLLDAQADSTVLGFWEGQVFCLETKLSEEQLVDFFCDSYAPTPIVSPWNGGSGFYEGDQRDAMDAILSSDDPRFADYRQVIEQVQSWPEAPETYPTIGHIRDRIRSLISSTSGKKAEELEKTLLSIESPEADVDWSWSLDELKARASRPMKSWIEALKKARTVCKQAARASGKEQMIALCRARLPEAATLWIDAACALESTTEVSYAHLLGSGGNEGRLDYSNNFMQRATTLLLDDSAKQERRPLIASALFGCASSGLSKASIGQFLPGLAGGYNQGTELETKDFKINPWDFVLTIEGTLVLASATVRRHGARRGSLSSPFSVRPTPTGYFAATAEESANSRGEIWLPWWQRPVRYRELRHVFAEGRATIGAKQAVDGVQFARAVGQLGVDRGLTGFTRYSLLKRRGDSYVALPGGRLSVRPRPSLRLLDELDPLLDRVSQFMRGFGNKTPPAKLASAYRSIQSAQYECATQPDARRFTALLRALGRLEEQLARRDRKKDPKLSRPLQGLTPAWLGEADDGSPELRLAAALASISKTEEVGPLRANLSPVDPHQPWLWDKGKGQVAYAGVSVTERLTHVMARRMMDASRGGKGSLPLFGALRLSCADVMPLLYGRVDDVKLEELLWASTWIDFRSDGLQDVRRAWEKTPRGGVVVSRSWALMKLLFDGRRSADIRLDTIKPEPRIIGFLQANRASEALETARRRLMVSGLRPRSIELDPTLNPLNLAASLLVPVANVSSLVRYALLPAEVENS
jgi:CRISPR-associated protein Csx17